MRALCLFLLLITPLYTIAAQDALEQARERLKQASGGLPSNVIDWTVANKVYGQNIRTIPAEFTVITTQPEIVVATAEGLEASPASVLTVLTAYLEQTATDQHNKSVAPNVVPNNPLYGGWFEYDLNVPDSVPSILQKLLTDKQYKNDTLGLLLSWPGNQVIKLSSRSIIIEPPIKASVRKFGVTASASITEIRFTPDYKTVTVVTPEVLVPDLTINFK